MTNFHIQKKRDLEQDLFSDLFCRHYNLMMKEARRFFSAPEDVEDIVQEAIANLIEKSSKLLSLPPPKQTTYIVTTVRNLSISVLRKRKCIEFIPLSDLGDAPLPDTSLLLPETNLSQKEHAERFRNTWHTLPLEDQDLLGRKYILGQTDAEIAKDLNIKPGSIRMALTRTRRRAQKKYFQQWKDYKQY